ncbi:hypothetical protein Hanom_Chr10g00954581 [Helianthus anomalus]
MQQNPSCFSHETVLKINFWLHYMCLVVMFLDATFNMFYHVIWIYLVLFNMLLAVNILLDFRLHLLYNMVMLGRSHVIYCFNKTTCH